MDGDHIISPEDSKYFIKLRKKSISTARDDVSF